jgi:ketosteroid isomerase-like protein
MQTEESRELVKRAWSEFATRELERIAGVFSDDAEWIAPSANSTAIALGVTDHMRGADAIAKFIAYGMRRLFTDVRVAFKGMYADGRFVTVEEEMTATLANGRPYVLTYCFIFECADGRIVRVREYMDTMSAFRQVFAGGHPLAASLPLSTVGAGNRGSTIPS